MGIDLVADELEDVAGNLLLHAVDQTPRSDRGPRRLPADRRTAGLTAANVAGIGLGGLAAEGYYESGSRGGLIVGYAAAPEHTYRRAIAALAAALRGTVG
jgi:hypothetical protein